MSETKSENGTLLPPESESIEGVIDHIVFRNDENGYTVAHFKPLDGSPAFPVIGSFVSVAAGQPLTLTGRWVMHPRFGKQFSVSSYKEDIPRSEVGIRNYLTGFIKGVGPVVAKRIVDHFGEDTIDILDNEPERMREVEGIGGAKAKQIAKSWAEQAKIKNVMMFLQSHSISIGYALKIYKQYGEGAIDVLRQDPYILSSDIFGIGFKIADRIALNLGIEKDSRVRLRAGIMFVLREASSDGHVFLPIDKLTADAVRILEAPPDSVEAALAETLSLQGAVVEDEGRVYLAPFHYAEKKVAEKLAKIISMQEPAPRLAAAAANLTAVEADLGFALADEQRKVLGVLAREKIAILTGGPGTGKTVTTKAVIRMFELAGKRVLLAAPTGRAAKRLAEATGRPSKTIHRLLEYKPQTNSFDRNDNNPLETDLLVLDETSMMDLLLMHHVLKAVKLHTRVLLVGDADQLPSVGAGNVLRDLISSGCVATVRLERIFRQEEGSTIIANAHRINSGEMPVLSSTGSGDNFFFFNQPEPEKCVETLVELCVKKIPERFGFDPMRQVQVISPMYKGVLGVENLNTLLQQRLNPNKDVQCGNYTFRNGDRVMQIKNNYDKEVYNGDVGLISRIDKESTSLVVDFTDQQVKYEFGELDQIVPAYAVTVHKSQGSEYPAVVLALTTHHFPMLQRNLIYTAITRARSLVVLVGSAKAIAIAVKNNKIEERYSALADRLSGALEDREPGRG